MEQIPPAPVDIPVPPPVHTDHVMRAIVCSIGAYFLFTAMQAAAKVLSETHSIIEISFYRNLIGLLPFMIYMRATGHSIFPKTNNPWFVFLRVFLGSTGVIVTFAAVKYMPMADATVIFFTGILLTPALAYFLLREYIGPHRWGAIIFGLIGVILMLHPSGEGRMIGFLLAFLAAFMQGTTAVILRHLRSESAVSVTFYFLLCGMLVPAFFMPFYAHTPAPSAWLLFILIGVSGALGQYLITRAYSMAPASVIAPFGYTGLIWAAMFDVALWAHVPGWSVYAGGAIIIASNFYIGHRERLAERRHLQTPV